MALPGRLLLALAAIFFSLPLLGEPLPTSVPEKVGLSSERLRHLTATLLPEVERKRIPGAVIAVARRWRQSSTESKQGRLHP